MRNLALYFLVFIFIISPENVLAARVDTVEITSPLMRKNIRTAVIIPDSYDGVKEYPLVVLLHGYSGNYSGWLRETPSLHQQADIHQIIIVCPDGGFNSWYFDSPVDSSVRYESFLAKELPVWLEKTYRLKPGKNFKAISGLSMGGHGALYVSFRNPDIYGAAGSMAGGVDIRPFPKNWDLTKVLGDTICCWKNWEKNTVINLADTSLTRFPALIIDCGVDDFFFDVNRALHKKLIEQRVPHDYTERPGAHNKAYWSDAVHYQLLFFKKYFDRQEPAAKQ